MFSKYNEIQLEISINRRKISGKSLNIRKLNDTLLNIPWAKEEITREIRKYFDLNKMA